MTHHGHDSGRSWALGTAAPATPEKLAADDPGPIAIGGLMKGISPEDDSMGGQGPDGGEAENGDDAVSVK